jgi:hypothetical protein
MVMIIGVVYALSRRNAKAELFIAEKLFPEGHTPSQWIGARDLMGVTISVIAFFAFYMALALVSDNVRLVSLLMLVTACIDFNTRRLINARVDIYLRNPQYASRPEDRNDNLLRETRGAIRDYLYKKPHLWKEAARAGGCAIAFAIAMSGARSVSYLVLMATLIVDEIVTWRWRAERDRALLPLLASTGAVKADGH